MAESSVDTQALRFYSDTVDVQINGKFCLFSIVNLGQTFAEQIYIKYQAADDIPNVFIISGGSSFALPVSAKPFQGLYIMSNGVSYSIVTDGKIEVV